MRHIGITGLPLKVYRYVLDRWAFRGRLGWWLAGWQARLGRAGHAMRVGCEEGRIAAQL